MERRRRQVYYLPLDADGSGRRQIWAARRFRMEVEHVRQGRHGGESGRALDLEGLALIGLKWVLKALGLYRRGARNARDIRIREQEVLFADLPPVFDGFTILHISDLHMDRMPGLIERALEVWNGRDVDLCVLTGDYRDRWRFPTESVMAGVRKLIGGIRSREGFVAVLGNHDHCEMVAPMESMGIRVLINETLRIRRGGESLRIVGADDVHAYRTEEAPAAFDDVNCDFCIGLVHSAELYDVAGRKGVNLYLCGHTHGGQVCLPGGHALTRSLRRGREFYKGTWHYRGMVGVTNHGVGTSGLPVRFNTRGELLVLRLRRRGEEKGTEPFSSPIPRLPPPGPLK